MRRLLRLQVVVRMSDGECPVVLITCSGISNTGKCTARAAQQVRQRYPELVEYHIDACGEGPLVVPEGLSPGSLKVIVIDGCGDFCGRKKAEQSGLKPACHVVATDCGVIKSGMDEPDFADIDAVCRVVTAEMRH